MEKLQAAIREARARRDGHRTGPRPVPHETGGAGEVGQDWAALPVMTPGPARLSRNRVVTLSDNPAAAPLDRLRSRIQQHMGREGRRRLAITSPEPGTGKTTVAANLAGSIARCGAGRAVLIEFDLANPCLARLFGQGGTGGVADLLAGRIGFDCHARRLGANVAVAMNFEPVADPARLFHATPPGPLLERIERTYRPDLVILDLPPVLSGGAAASLLPHVDCALIVARAEVTPIAAVDAAEREVAAATDMLGVVLNRSRTPEAADAA